MEIKKFLVKATDSIHEVIRIIDKNKTGIALVTSDNGELIGTVTDGDIRRCMISGCDFKNKCADIMNKNPITATKSDTKSKLHKLIKQHRIRHIPIIDENRVPFDLYDTHNFFNHYQDKNIAVIMAGGEGTRLRPITNNMPKPMIKIGDQPLLEQIIKKLEKNNFKKIYITVNYMAESIENYVGDGKEFGVQIEYIRETKKLGTAGALSLIETDSDKPFLVMNGDVITEINFSSLLEFHKIHRSALSMAATVYKVNIPYGVVNLANYFVTKIEEKPLKRFFCNAGIYMIDQEVIEMIPKNGYYDMTDLVTQTLKSGLPVMAFPVHEKWIDIGNKEDLEKAMQDWKDNNFEKMEKKA